MFVAERQCEEHFTIGTLFGPSDETYLPRHAREANALRLMMEPKLDAVVKNPECVFVEEDA